MGVFLVVPDGDVLAGAVVVDGGMTLRTASLGNAAASGTSRSWGVQPGKDRTSGRMTFPPGRLGGRTGRRALPELKGVLTIRGFEESNGRHLE